MPRLGIALVLALGLHAALWVRAQHLAHGAHLMAMAPAMSVRLVELAPSETAPMAPAEATPKGYASVDRRDAANLESAPETPIRTNDSEAAPPPRPSDPMRASRMVQSDRTRAAVTAAAKSAPVKTSTSTGPNASSPPPPPPSPAGLPAAPDYLFSATLDPGPQPIDDIEPEYPGGAEDRPGSVVLRLLISEVGHVDNVAVVRATPPGVFDAAAIDAFSKARFLPAKLLGIAVKAQLTIEVKFTPLDRGARVSGRSY